MDDNARPKASLKDDEDDKYSDDGYEDENSAPNSPTRKDAEKESGGGDSGGISHGQSEPQSAGDQRPSTTAVVDSRSGAEGEVAAEKGASKGRSKSGAAALDVAFRAPSHLPNSPRPLSLLPKESNQNSSLLKLAQR